MIHSLFNIFFRFFFLFHSIQFYFLFIVRKKYRIITITLKTEVADFPLCSKKYFDISIILFILLIFKIIWLFYFLLQYLCNVMNFTQYSFASVLRVLPFSRKFLLPIVEEYATLNPIHSAMNLGIDCYRTTTNPLNIVTTYSQ